MSLYVDFALMRLTLVDTSPPQPALDISPLDSATLQLSWPTNAVGYSLESASSFPAQVWSPVTNSLTSIGEFFVVELSITEPRQFYRLRK
jgi:hypothetical protein